MDIFKDLVGTASDIIDGVMLNTTNFRGTLVGCRKCGRKFRIEEALDPTHAPDICSDCGGGE